jgi:PAS domain S-box-containing protein
MIEIAPPITKPVSLEWPSDLLGWFAWFLFLVIIILLNRQWWTFNQPLNQWRKRTLIFLVISVPFLTLIIPGFQFQLSGDLFSVQTSPVLLLAAVPWFLAAGLLGPAGAATIAMFSGVMIALWGDHNSFFPLELTILATWLGWMMFQRYRTPLFRGLRHPILAAIVLSFSYILLELAGSMFLGQGSLVDRVDHALLHIGPASISLIISVMVAGVVAEVVSLSVKSYWGARKASLPSPAESKLTGRFLFSVVPLSVILLIILIVGDWVVARNAARQMLQGQMEIASETAAQSVPFFLETGQNIILRMARENNFDQSPEQLRALLLSERREVPYFSQLIYVDVQGNYIASDPDDAINSLELSSEELDGINLASIVPTQIVSITPLQGSKAAILSFITGVENQDGDLVGVLLGRNDLAANPFAKPLLTSIESLSSVDGEGVLVDQNGFILYHPDPSKIMTQYLGWRGEIDQFYELSSPEETSRFIYYRPAVGQSWDVIFTVPAKYAQQQALDIALPLLGIISILSIAAIFIFRFGLRVVTSSLYILTVEADRMSHGKLDNPLTANGEDEVGQLRRAFEKMRKSLKSRMDEQNRLLIVSRGVASTLDLEESIKPVLDAALVTEASSARVFLLPSVMPNTAAGPSAPFRFGAGYVSEQYAYLDEQVVELTRKQDILKLSSLTRPRLLSFPQDSARPDALLAVALRHENLFYGTLWLAFEHPHRFFEEETRYVVTLAGYAALAAANARLFLTAEIGRQRLEAILTSTPDPVLVTDQSDNLILTNVAAQRVFGLDDETSIGKPIFDVITHEEFATLMRAATDQPQSAELQLDNEKVYFATSSPIQADGQGIGRVCVLRDVTSFKQLDALKSEFVSTVSHDLRSPLALIQGYTSMLEFVGELNAQQSEYLKKITLETEKTSHLVKNLLDLGRIEAGIGLRLEKKPVDDVVHRVVDALQMQANQKRIQLNTEKTETELPLIEGDQALLQQALYNLVENAIEFTDSGGTVGIRLKMGEEHVIYEVFDNGIGISPADQHKLFERFFRVSRKERREEGGSGLGLAIVKSIADKHGGKVWVKSQLGTGSTFFLEVPLKQNSSGASSS